MKPHVEIKMFALQALSACCGEPMPREALITQTQLALPHLRPTEEQVGGAIVALLAQRLIVATEDLIQERTAYTITERGEAQLKAR